MKRFNKIIMLAAFAAVVVLAGGGPVQAQNVDNYTEQGGSRDVIGGSLDIISGGELDIESGGALEISGTDVTTGVGNIANLGTVNTLEGTVTLDCDTHGKGAVNYVSSGSANATITHPAASGSGCVIELTWLTEPAGSGDTLQVTGDDEFVGILQTLTDDSDNMEGWEAVAGSDNDQITFDSATKMADDGLLKVILKDGIADRVDIEAVGSSTGAEASPLATGQRS